jgi:hypothetical protein
LFDEYNTVIEAKNIADKYVATKHNPDKTLLSKVANARYESFTHSSAEFLPQSNYLEGEVKLIHSNDVLRVLASSESITAHTGKYVVKVNSGSDGFYFKVPLNTSDYNRTYRASVWVNAQNISSAAKLVGKVYAGGTLLNTYDITTSVENIQVNNWYLLKINIPVPGSGSAPTYLEVYVSNTGSNPVYFDDLQVAPLDAGIESFVYDKYGLLEYQIDAENFYSRIEYDETGRPEKTYKETGNGIQKASEYMYNYVRKP